MSLKNKSYRYLIRVLKQYKEHSPHYFARSVCVGIVFGISPIIGQTALCFAMWTILRLFKIHFSLILSCALTFITNPATTPFLCYFYYLTGQMLMGSKSLPFKSFLVRFNKIFSEELSLRSVYEVAVNLIKGMGAPIAIGYVLWAIVAGGVSYFLSYRIARYWKNRKRGKAGS
ncbi:MAG: DUF2062 domain-containing protein [Alphaproteobacteria bacterium]|nr:DUF2062 domain-containing protein [Alphaproteobacteria bacterium]